MGTLHLRCICVLSPHSTTHTHTLLVAAFSCSSNVPSSSSSTTTIIIFQNLLRHLCDVDERTETELLPKLLSLYRLSIERQNPSFTLSIRLICMCDGKIKLNEIKRKHTNFDGEFRSWCWTFDVYRKRVNEKNVNGQIFDPFIEGVWPAKSICRYLLAQRPIGRRKMILRCLSLAANIGISDIRLSDGWRAVPSALWAAVCGS